MHHLTSQTMYCSSFHVQQDLCAARGIHCTIYATGCIFEYDDDHTIGGKPFTEEDNANFDGSFYSLTKGMVEQMLRVYPHVSNNNNTHQLVLAVPRVLINVILVFCLIELTH
jgi:hypothetical protein